MSKQPLGEIENQLDEIFSLEFIAAPEMLIDTKDLLFRWNPEWLEEAKSQIRTLVATELVKAKIEELERLLIHHKLQRVETAVPDRLKSLKGGTIK